MTRKTRRSNTGEGGSQGGPGDPHEGSHDEPAKTAAVKPAGRKAKAGKTDSVKPDPATKADQRAAAELETKEPAPSQPNETAPNETAPNETAPSKKAPEKKISLPAFGFAEDLLKKAQKEPVAEEVAGPRESTIEDTDPRRIFAFADSLANQRADDETLAVPVKLRTWVAFSLAGEVFALPVDPVHEVVRVATITRVPHAPKPIRGVTNMRGRVIPVIDLRLRIELPSAELGRSSRVIVVSSRGRLLGLLVDAVHQVIHIDLNRVQPPPDDVMTVQSDYISGVYHLEDQLILLLDINRVLIIQDGPADKAADATRDTEAPDTTTGHSSPMPS